MKQADAMRHIDKVLKRAHLSFGIYGNKKAEPVHKFGEEIYINPFGRNVKAEQLRAKRHKSGAASCQKA